MGRDSFIIYKSFYKPISRLSDKQLGRLFRAIFMYHLDEVVSVEEDIEMAFEFFKNQFELDENKYQGIVARNRENGRKGGAPKGNKNAASEGNEEQPKQPTGLKTTQTTQNKPNDNDNDILDKKKILSDESIKEKALSALSCTAPEYAKFVKWLIEKAPYCFENMKLPTEAEFIKLKKLGTTQQITEVIQQIENRKDLRKRYSNLYRTILNWMKNE